MGNQVILCSPTHTKFTKGNLATITTDPLLPDRLAIWSHPPTLNTGKITNFLHENDLVLILDILDMDQHTQFSKIFSANRNTIGWTNSRFLNTTLP
jgi:hypothetical protein